MDIYFLRRFVFIVLVLFCIFQFPEAADEVSGRSVYIIGTILDSPPYSFLGDDGLPSGYDVDLTRAVARTMNLKFEIRTGPWEELRQDLENGRIDAIAGMYYSAQRDQRFEFSTPYIVSHYTFFARHGETEIETEEDVRGKEVIVLSGDIIHEYITEQGWGENLVLVESAQEALQLLDSGKHDCAILSRLQGLYWKRELKLGNIVTTGSLLSPSQACFAVKAGDVVLQQLISEGLTTLGQTGEHKIIYDRWLGVLDPRGVSQATVWKWLGIGTGVIFLLVVLFLIWSQLLRQQVASRTKALEESRGRFRELAEMLPEGVFEINRDLDFTFINRRACEISGYSAEEIKASLHPFDLVRYEDRARMMDGIKRRINGERLGPVEYPAKKKDGSTVPVLIHATPIIKDGEYDGLRGIIVDISERKSEEEERVRLKEQYQQAQKEDSLGRLAGGVAHDLNNLLTPILGYGEIMKNDLEGDEKLRDSLDQIMKAGTRARDLVGKLLAFGRKQKLDYRTVDLNQVLTGFEALLRRTIREDVEIEIITNPERCLIKADIGQIEQVLLNLAVNGQDAMPGGGKLSFQTKIIPMAQAPLDIDRNGASEQCVKLTVRDTGTGMDAATLKHVFEPFYSTKGTEGTGLGLATVYGIIKQHGGNVRVVSKPGQGTTFSIYLPPCLDSGIEETIGEIEDLELEGSETILLVEDNEQVRELAVVMLEMKGYTVLHAQDGPGALAQLEANGRDVQLLLTDVILPGMNGRELYTRVCEDFPGIKVLYMSGYTDEVVARHGVFEDGVAFIQKPFTGRDLAAGVRGVLDRREDYE